MKTCTQCQMYKPDNRFSRRKYHGSIRLYCKDCANANERARRGRMTAAERSALDRHRKLRDLYGITETAFAHRLKLQGGGCAICRTTSPGGRWKRFHVDHCHDTGSIRGLLCDACNRALGFFRHDPMRLLAASEYLSDARNTGSH